MTEITLELINEKLDRLLARDFAAEVPKTGLGIAYPQLAGYARDHAASKGWNGPTVQRYLTHGVARRVLWDDGNRSVREMALLSANEVRAVHAPPGFPTSVQNFTTEQCLDEAGRPIPGLHFRPNFARRNPLTQENVLDEAHERIKKDLNVARIDDSGAQPGPDFSPV